MRQPQQAAAKRAESYSSSRHSHFTVRQCLLLAEGHIIYAHLSPSRFRAFSNGYVSGIVSARQPPPFQACRDDEAIFLYFTVSCRFDCRDFAEAAYAGVMLPPRSLQAVILCARREPAAGRITRRVQVIDGHGIRGIIGDIVATGHFPNDVISFTYRRVLLRNVSQVSVLRW